MNTGKNRDFFLMMCLRSRNDGRPRTLTVTRTTAVMAIPALAWLAIAQISAPALAAADEMAATAVPPAPGPQDVMADLTARLFALLDNESAATRHNADSVLPLVDKLLSPNFDREYAAHLVLGAHWRDATLEQRQRFAAALYRRLLRTYSGSVAEWTEERVKQLPLRSDPAALQVTVHTQITDSRGSIVAVDFRLRQTADGWKIFDVIVDGVSYVRNYHDDTDAEIVQAGLDAAIARLAAAPADSADSRQRSRPAPHQPQ
ncbi:MAG: ABC transporter substrate-binding protein [Steroidobacteraceae bacterium]